ncbi:MAG: C40 family peptidase [bacterium]
MRSKRGPLLLLALVLVLAWGCAFQRPAGHHYHVDPVSARLILRAARSQLGEPYAYGGHSPNTGFDCSGLVYWCYRSYGSIMPRTAREQYKVGVPVDRRDLQAGDLVFFETASGPEQPSHVGIMLDHRRFIHAPAGGQVVREDELRNNFWNHSYYGARRIE